MTHIRAKRYGKHGRHCAVSVMAAGASLLAVATLLSGCNHENPMGLSDQQQQGIDRQHEILRNAGGDWNKVSDADRDFLIKGTGSEESAKQMVAHQGSNGRAPAGQYGPPQSKGEGTH